MNSNLVSQNTSTIDERLDAAVLESTSSEKRPIEAKPSLRSQRAAAEVLAIRAALQETGWNRKRTAKLLSISYRGLLYKIRQHGIVPMSEDKSAETVS